MNSMPDRAEVDSFNRVWDHRWALPATIYAITTRIAVLKAFSAPDEILKPELQRYVDFLGAVFRKMESGLRFKRDFTNYEINYMVVPGGRTPVAAVDIYGGYFIHNVFTIYFNPAEFEGFPYFPGIVLLTHVLELNYILDNVKRVGRYWRDIIAQQIGLPELLWICGQLENLIEPPQPFTVRKHFYGETGEGSETAGVIFSVQPNGDLHWYRYVGNGEADVSGSTGWHPNSGNRIGNGWHMFNKLVCCGDGVILGIEPNGTLRWYRYVGHGEDDVSGSTGWHQNSGNPIGNGWQLMRNLIALKSVYATYGLTILTVAQNGDLLWHSYGGNGESDITGRTGWHPNSGNPIGNGWQGHRHLHGSGNVIFAVRENGDLHWYRYDGDGQADVSGSTGWFENSGNRVATGWHTFRHIFGGATDYVGYGQVLFTVSENGDLLWHRYAGLGWADISGWIANSGNAIGNGW
jgi:hypothetical protein